MLLTHSVVVTHKHLVDVHREHPPLTVTPARKSSRGSTQLDLMRRNTYWNVFKRFGVLMNFSSIQTRSLIKRQKFAVKDDDE